MISHLSITAQDECIDSFQRQFTANNKIVTAAQSTFKHATLDVGIIDRARGTMKESMRLLRIMKKKEDSKYYAAIAQQSKAFRMYERASIESQRLTMHIHVLVASRETTASWLKNKDSMSEIHPQIRQGLSTLPIEGCEITKDFVPYDVWIDYYATKYNLVRIIRKLKLADLGYVYEKLRNIANAMPISFVGVLEVMHLSTLVGGIATKIDYATAIDTLLAGIRGRSPKETLAFIRTLCILFR